MKSNKKFKRNTSAILALSFALSCGALLNVKADGEPITKLHIHKLKYSNDLAHEKMIQNDGTEKQYDASISPYDASIYGRVGFTLYKLDKAKVLQLLKEKLGNSQEVANTLAGDIKKYTDDGTIMGTIGEEKFQTGTEAITYDAITMSSEQPYYLLTESTSPKASVSAKAQAMLLQLPMMAKDGRTFLTDVHVYPKNKVDDSKRVAKFKKFLVEDTQKAMEKQTGGGKIEADGLEHAKFMLLYSQTEPTSLDDYKPVQSDHKDVVVESAKDGSFEVADLKEGWYALRELDTDKIDVIGQGNAVNNADIVGYKELIPFYYDGVNGVRRYKELDKDGKTVTDSAQALFADYTHRYQIRAMEKSLSSDDTFAIVNTSTIKTKKTVDEMDFGIGELRKFTLTISNLPDVSQSGGKLVIKDEATEGLKIYKDTIKVKVFKADGTTEELDKSAFKVDQPSLNHIVLSMDIANNSEMNGKLYKKIEVTYTATLTKALEKIINTANPVFNDGKFEFTPKEDPNHSNRTESYSYNQKFKKVDSGLWNTGAVKTPLKGAKFIVSKQENGATVYRAKDADTTYTWVKDKSKAFEYESKDDGTFEIEGLANKIDNKMITYTLEEVKAPDNYQLPLNMKDRQHEFTVDKNKTDKDEVAGVITISNDRSVDAPMTGYEKSVITVAVLAMGAGIGLVITKKRKHNAKA